MNRDDGALVASAFNEKNVGEVDLWTALAGPAAFGRSLMIAPGVHIPSPWKNAEKLRLNGVTLQNPATLQRVRHAFLTRTPIVYEVEPETKVPERGTDEREVWEVQPNADFVAEATWRLARANAVDASDPTRPTWPQSDMAIAAGSRPSDEATADVILPNGMRAWCDGGPVHLWEEGAQQFGGVVVVPRISLVKGLLTPVSARNPTAALAPDQLAAVADPSTRARIIAPAGSGKTRVLTERARHLLNSGIPVDSLLLVAFNKRAQIEMRERTAEHPHLQIQTLNALALSILNGSSGFASRSTRLQTIDEREVRSILSTYVKFPRKTNTDPVATWIDALTEVRLRLRSPQTVEAEYRGDIEGFSDFFPLYRQHLADHQQVDFDEQIYLAIEVLLREPKVRLAAERRAEVLLVDEFQDLAPAHMLLLRLLAGPPLSVFAVGDDDQTIYGYSGATPEWLVQFEQHVPDAVHHALEVNYRCPAPVVSAAFNLLSRNVERIPKVIRSGPNNVHSPSSLEVAKVDDQIQHLTTHIQTLVQSGAEPKNIAVLSRVNANLVPVQVALVEAGIAFNVRDKGQFLRASGVQSALAWFRLAVRPDHLVGDDIELAVRRPGRGLRPDVRGWMGEQTTIEGLKRLAGRVDEKSSPKIDAFVDDIKRIAKFAESATSWLLVEFIQRDIGLERALATLDVSHQGRNSPSNSDGLRSLIALGHQHPDTKTFDVWLKNLLNTPSAEDGVTLATVHSVKGLEWPNVIVYDASSMIFPHRLSVDGEEERRVFHVAITRCTESLLITADAKSPSIFLNEFSAPYIAPRQTKREAVAPSKPKREAASQSKSGREAVVPSTNGAPSGFSPITAEVGLHFTWGGYDFVIRSVRSDGVDVSTSETRTSSLPFGWTVKINEKSRTLVAPGGATAINTSAPTTGVDSDLYNALKTWRLEQARADKVPAYVIFKDQTLDELCRVRPLTVTKLLGIGGIGPSKADRFGDQILAIIEELSRI